MKKECFEIWWISRSNFNIWAGSFQRWKPHEKILFPSGDGEENVFLGIFVSNNYQFSANFSEMSFWDFFKEFSLEDTTFCGLFGPYFRLSRSVIRWGTLIFEVRWLENFAYFCTWDRLFLWIFSDDGSKIFLPKFASVERRWIGRRPRKPD